jgi:hypothetical protein
LLEKPVTRVTDPLNPFTLPTTMLEDTFVFGPTTIDGELAEMLKLELVELTSAVR